MTAIREGAHPAKNNDERRDMRMTEVWEKAKCYQQPVCCVETAADPDVLRTSIPLLEQGFGDAVDW